MKTSKNRNYYFYLTYSSLYLLKITVQEQQGMHIDELKPVSKRRRLLLKHRVESEPQEAVRTEVNAYLQAKVSDDIDDDPLIF